MIKGICRFQVEEKIRKRRAEDEGDESDKENSQENADKQRKK